MNVCIFLIININVIYFNFRFRITLFVKDDTSEAFVILKDAEVRSFIKQDVSQVMMKQNMVLKVLYITAY